MKNTLLLLALFIGTSNAFTQDLPAAGGVSNNIIGHTAFAEAYDLAGRPLTEVNKKVAGSTVLNENWGKGQVIFQNDFLLKNVELQFDCYSNEIHFRKNNIIYAFADPLKGFSMEYPDNGQLRTVTFRSGYPAIQKKTEGSFYEVIADGKNVVLLNYVSKEIRENYTYAGPLKIEYQQTDAYYVYDVKEGDIKPVEMRKASLIKALPVFAEKIKNFATGKNYKLRSENEVIELFKELNPL